jgi:uncharacterized protein (TIRG00374 family)
MSFKAWLSIVTLALVGVIIFFSRHELLHAWELLGRVNIWILLLLIPGQILVYYIGGEMMFSYLREKDAIRHIPASDLTKMSLEMNFVNHVLPTGGVSGISYMAWRLNKYGVPLGRATMAQMVRFTMTFVAYITLLLVAVLVVTIDGNINRWIIFVSSSLVLMTVVMVVATVYLLSSRERMWRFGGWLVRTTNHVVRKITFGRRRVVLRYGQVEKFFTDMHFDYLALRRDMRILTKPFLWGIAFTLADVSLFLITFWAMGSPVNPAPVLIAYGVAGMTGLVVATPGGAGAYEAVMVGFLALAGLEKSTAIAGIVLTRVILLLGTIILGYAFYQSALLKYGKRNSSSSQR